MLGVTTLPERAVDTWVAAYLSSQFPHASLWAPTQRTEVDFDLSVSEEGKLFVLEQKAPVYHKKDHLHYIQVDVARQLWRYCTDPGLAGLVWYVLPMPPYPAAYAAGRGSSLMPDLSRARVSGHGWGNGLPCEDWFHMVPARDLYEWVWSRGGPRFMPPLPPVRAAPPAPPPPVVGKRSFPCNEIVIGGPQNTMTLRGWVTSVKACSVEGGLVKDGRVVRVGRLLRDGEVIDEGRKVSIPISEPVDDARPGRVGEDGQGNDAAEPSRSPGSTRVVFVPHGDIPGWM
jgi:hypothetical protein